jgi:proteic killer suppression protein
LPYRHIPFDGNRFADYDKITMIRSFACPDTEQLFESKSIKRFKNIEQVARRKLLILHAAIALSDLKVPPGNRLEALAGDRKGQHSIRINDQWRLCFKWFDGGADNVEIVDYH